MPAKKSEGQRANEDLLREKLQTYLDKKEIKKAFIAKKLKRSPTTVNKWFNGTNLMSAEDLGELCAVFELDQQQRSELFKLAGYFDNNVTPRGAKEELELDRAHYLERLHKHCRTLILPIARSESIALDDVFQPLKLRRDPQIPEELTLEQRRHLLGERRGDTDSHREQIESDRNNYRNQSRPATPAIIADDADDALKKSAPNSMIVLGNPGTGKTTLLKSLVSTCIRNAFSDPNAPLPVFISLDAFIRANKDFVEYLHNIVHSLGVDDRFVKVLLKALQDGRVLVCLDGLDKIDHNREQRMHVIKMINDACASFPDNTWIVTSRFTDYTVGLFSRERFTEWELQPMSSAVRQRLAQRLIPKVQPLIGLTAEADPNMFVKELEEHQRVVAWGENPLLFTLAAIVFSHTGSIPSSRTELYQQILDDVLKMYELLPVQRGGLRRILSELSLDLYLEHGIIFTIDDLLEIVLEERYVISNTVEIINSIKRSGMLQVVAKETYGFWHQTFQEYLVAVALARQLMSSDQKLQEKTYDLVWQKHIYGQWAEVLRLMIGVLAQEHGEGGMHKAQVWLAKLAHQQSMPSGDPGNRGLGLALKSLNEVPESMISKWQKSGGRKLEREILTAWVDRLLDAVQNRSQTEQIQLVAFASEYRYANIFWQEEVKSRLLTVLADQNEAIRAVAVTALGFLKITPIGLFEDALQDKSSAVRTSAAEVLGKRGGSNSAELLYSALLNALSEAVNGIDMFDDFMENNDPLSFERATIVKALGALKNHMEKDSLVTILLSMIQDPSEQVRVATVEVIGQLGEYIPTEHLPALLSSERVSVRVATVRALGELDTLEAIDLLMKSLLEEPWEVREAALQGLKRVSKHIALEPVIDALHDDHELVRVAALELLGTLGEKMPHDKCEVAISDESELVRAAAIQVLGKRVPLDRLMHILHSSGGEVDYWAVLWELYERRARVPFKVLLHYLHYPDVHVRRAAALVLQSQEEYLPLEGYSLLEQLLAALGERGSEIRMTAVRILEHLREQVPVETFVAVIENSDEWHTVRLEAIQWLQLFPSLVPIEPLEAILNNSNEWPDIKDAAKRMLEESRAQKDEGASEDEPFAGEEEPTEMQKFGGLEEPVAESESGLDFVIIDGSDIEWSKVRGASLNELVRFLSQEESRKWSKVRGASLNELVRFLSHNNSRVREKALDELGKLRLPAPIEPLIGCLHDEDVGVRQMAVRVLGRLGKRVPVEPLLEALGDNSCRVRDETLRVLSRVHPDAFFLLRNEAEAILLNRGSGAILGPLAQTFIAETIGNMRSVSDSMFSMLMELLDAPHWQVQLSAIQALYKLHSIPAKKIERLHGIQLDETRTVVVRKAANNALSRILSLEGE
jgi:HEAT repeat protein